MSRCLPYPQPGYSAKRYNNEALIESIKLQKEREKAKAERKDRKREKKEKKDRKREKKEEDRKREKKEEEDRKREKKEKKREHKAIVEQHGTELNCAKKRKHGDEKAYKLDKVVVDLKGYYKSTEDEAEEVERSGLTEEHEQPVCSQNACDSSGSTKNCEKRGQASPGSSIKAHGNILRIRLSLRNHKEPDATVVDERSCSTSGRMHKEPDATVGCSTSRRKDMMGKHNGGVGPAPGLQESNSISLKTDVSGQGFTPGIHRQQNSTSAPSTSRGISGPDDVRTKQSITPVDSRMMKMESVYKNLVGNLDLPLLDGMMQANDDDELDWLCQRKQQDRKSSKAKASSKVARNGSLALWPRAQYLSEADIYALPFALPF